MKAYYSHTAKLIKHVFMGRFNDGRLLGRQSALSSIFFPVAPPNALLESYLGGPASSSDPGARFAAATVGLTGHDASLFLRSAC
jgi:hypothetical protein